MKNLSIKSCLTALFSIGCLLIILLILLAIIFFVRGESISNLLNHDIVRVDGANKSSQNTHLFPKSKNVRLKIALISDTENDIRNLYDALETAKEHDADMVIHLGDLSQLGVLEDLDNMKLVFDQSGLEYYATPGDRDLWAYLYGKYQSVNGFQKVFGDGYRFISKNDNGFLIIDNADEFYGIDDDQWKFIEENLPNADFVFLHNPIEFDDSLLLGHKGMGQYDENVEKQRVKLLDMIRNSNVKAVFAGDQHRFTEFKDSSGKDLYFYIVGATNAERNLEYPSFAILTIYEDGDFYVKKIELN